MTLESRQVPTISLADGRKFIPTKTIAEYPFIREFVLMLPWYWAYDPIMDGYVSAPTKKDCVRSWWMLCEAQE